MLIHTLWGWREGEDGPELMVAWDEWCVDGNRQGYEEDKQKAIKSWGDDLHESREIVLRINYEDVQEAFFPVEIAAQVRAQEEPRG